MLKLIVLLITFALSSTRKEAFQIAYIPSPGNFEVIPTFVKFAEFLTIIKGYGCVALVHGADRNAWDKTPCTQIKYGAGDGDAYTEKLFAAENVFETKSLLSVEAFRELYEMLITSFFESNALFELKKLDIDVVVCDSSNFLCNVIAEKLKISKKVYHAPTAPSPYWIDVFESSASHHPVMTSPYTNLMGLWQRFMNYVNHFIVAHSIRSQRKLFAQVLKEKENEKIDPDHFFDPISLFTTQGLRGFNFPLYLPPNVVNLGCVSCMLPHQTTLEINKFLGKYSQNVFIKLDRIDSQDLLKNVLDTVEELKKIGFILQADLPKGLKFPANLHMIDYIPTVDLLSNSKINGFVHDADWSSIIESVYYRKPMVALAYHYDSKANGALVEDRGIGITFYKEHDITKKHLVSSIKDILDPKSSYGNAVLKYSKIAVAFNTTKHLEKWFDDYINNGIEHLVVKPFYEMSFYQYYNLDVWFVFVVLPIVAFLTICSLFRRLIGRLRRGKVSKQVTDQKKQHRENDIGKEKTE